VSWKSSRQVAAAIPGARFELIPRAGHVPYLSNPRPFNEAVQRFLDDVDRARTSRAPDAEAAGGRAPSAQG
jgi:hypothetical protein